MALNQQANENAGRDKQGKPQHAEKQIKYFFPFRFLQYLTRLSQREDSQQGGEHNHPNTGDADLMRTLKRIDKCYQRIRSRITSGGVTAMVTVALAVFSWRLYTATVDQNNVMIRQLEEMRIEKRAWLGLIQPTIEAPVAGKKIVCHAPMKNSGGTPANIIRAVIAIAPIKGDPLPDRIQEILEKAAITNPHENSVPPEGVTNFVVDDAATLNQGEIDRLNNGTLKLILAGLVAYRDNTGAVRTTRFTCLFDTDTKTLIATPYGNHMD